MKLTDKICVPCSGDTPPLKQSEIQKLLKQIKSGWKVLDNVRIQKKFKFNSYPETIAFVNKVALIAQEEGHHPDLQVHYYDVVVEFSTHAIKGLSENDFIMAAKIEA